MEQVKKNGKKAEAVSQKRISSLETGREFQFEGFTYTKTEDGIYSHSEEEIVDFDLDVIVDLRDEI